MFFIIVIIDLFVIVSFVAIAITALVVFNLWIMEPWQFHRGIFTLNIDVKSFSCESRDIVSLLPSNRITHTFWSTYEKRKRIKFAKCQRASFTGGTVLHSNKNHNNPIKNSLIQRWRTYFKGNLSDNPLFLNLLLSFDLLSSNLFDSNYVR